MNNTPEVSSFFAHYEELRSRLIKSIAAVLVAACFFYIFIDEIFAVIVKPVGRLIFTAPGEAFSARITLSFVGGLFLSLPVVLYQIWRFVSVGLKEQEIKYVRIFAPCSFLLFIIGGLFAYFVAVPVSIRFLLGFSNDFVVPMITVKNYVSFVGTMLIVFGIIFELPLVLMFLTKIGVASPGGLAQKRKYAIVIILTISAFITPPDCVTQIIVAVPLVALYETGVLASRLTYKEKHVR